MKRTRISSGQSLMEFALTFPLLILLVLGLFDLGRAVFYYATLNTAVREATRFAIVLSSTETNKEAKIAAKASSFMWSSELKDNCSLTGSLCKITISYYYPPPPEPYSNDPYDPTVSVTITYQFDVITPGLSLLIGHGGTFPLEVHSTMLLSPYAKPAY